MRSLMKKRAEKKVVIYLTQEQEKAMMRAIERLASWYGDKKSRSEYGLEAIRRMVLESGCVFPDNKMRPGESLRQETIICQRCGRVIEPGEQHDLIGTNGDRWCQTNEPPF